MSLYEPKSCRAVEAGWRGFCHNFESEDRRVTVMNYLPPRISDTFDNAGKAQYSGPVLMFLFIDMEWA